MKRFLLNLSVLIISAFGTFSAFACTADQIDTGTDCVEAKFIINTTAFSASNKLFKFYMTAKGTFYVDWGDGNVETISRTNVTEAPYEHTYETETPKVIRFGGVATGYNGNVVNYPAIRFGNITGGSNNDATRTRIASVDGSLGALFPRLKNVNIVLPSFSDTFHECTNLTSIPAGLFSGLTGNRAGMFYQTFVSCSKLTSIPDGLFSGITGAGSQMFRSTFWGTAITTIPKNLFAGIRGGGVSMFYSTFRNCTHLTSIPEGLFAGITTSAESMFESTFQGCTSLGGFIPASAFGGLIDAGSPTATNMWTSTFSGTQLSTTTCPPSWKLVETGYKTAWGGRIACMLPAPKIITTSYVQGFYDEIDATKQDRLESGVNVITTGAPDGLVVSVTADHGIVRVHKEEIQIPVGSVENPTNWLPIWVE